MFNRKIKTRLDFLTRTAQQKIKDRQYKYHHGKRFLDLEVGELVYVRDYRILNKPTWTKAKIEQKLGLENYLCRVLDDNRLFWRRHLDQIVQVGQFYGEFDKVLNKCNDLSQKDNENRFTSVISRANEKEDVSEEQGSVSEQLETTSHADRDFLDNQADSELPKNEDSASKIVLEGPSANLRPRRNIKPPQRLNL